METRHVPPKIRKLADRFGIPSPEACPEAWSSITTAQVLKQKGVGVQALADLREWLWSQGVSLADDQASAALMRDRGIPTEGFQYATISPFQIAVDTREQKPWHFTGFDSLIIPTCTRTLKSGDYSIPGYESRVAVERKSLQDLYGTLSQGRDRFGRELERLSEYEVAAVVVEASWEAVISDPPLGTTVAPKTIFRSVLAYQQRFRKVHWHLCGTVSFAERVCYRVLERFFWDEVEGVVRK